VAHTAPHGLLWPVLGVALLGSPKRAFLHPPKNCRPATTTVEATMRGSLYHHLQHLPIASTDRWQSGQLLVAGGVRPVHDRRFIAFVGVFLIVNTLILIAGWCMLFSLNSCSAWWCCWRGAADRGLTIFERKYKIVARLAQGPAAATWPPPSRNRFSASACSRPSARGPHLAAKFFKQARDLRGTEMAKVRIISIIWGAIVLLPEVAIAGQLLVGTLAITHGR